MPRYEVKVAGEKFEVLAPNPDTAIDSALQIHREEIAAGAKVKELDDNPTREPRPRGGN